MTAIVLTLLIAAPAAAAQPASATVTGHYSGDLRIEVGDRAYTTDQAPAGVVTEESAGDQRLRLFALDDCSVLAAVTAISGHAYQVALSGRAAVVSEYGDDVGVDAATKWTETSQSLQCQPDTETIIAGQPAGAERGPVGVVFSRCL